MIPNDKIGAISMQEGLTVYITVLKTLRRH